MVRILTPAAVLLFGFVMHAQTVPIYDSIPAPLPPAFPYSKAFEATQTSEYGNEISFGGTNRRLKSVTVGMAAGSYFTFYNPPDSTNTGSWSHEITLNLYSVNEVDGHPQPGNLIASVKQQFLIPWRPEPDPGCDGTRWRSNLGTCHSTLAFPITFDFSSLALTLPDRLIFGIAYNTQSAGENPIGTVGPYNSLNVGLRRYEDTPAVGTNQGMVYLNSNASRYYTDMGPTGVFRLDVGNKDPIIAIQFNVPPRLRHPLV